MSFWIYLRDFLNPNFFTIIFVLFLAALYFLKFLPGSLKSVHWVLIGLALRTVWLLFSSHVVHSDWHYPLLSENDMIHIHAVELTQGIWFHDMYGVPTGRRPIGYPIFLGLLYKIFGSNPWVAQLSGLALYAVSAVLIYRIAKILFGKRLALLALAFYSLYPTSIYSIKLITDEHLFLPLLYLGLYLLLREARGKRAPGALVAYGVIFGYATMTRTHTIFMPFVVAWAYLLMKKSWRRVVLAFVIVLTVMQLVNLPWVIRNTKVCGIPVLYTTTGENLYFDLNAYAKPEGGGYMPVAGDIGYSEELGQAQREGKGALSHTLAMREIAKFILADPLRFIDFGSKRLLIFMGWKPNGVWSIWYQFYEGSFDPARPLPDSWRFVFEGAAYASYYIVLVSFLISLGMLAAAWKKLNPISKRGLLVLSSVFIFWWAEHMIIFPDRKYRFPIEPLMIVVSSWFLSKVLWEWKWKSR